MTLRVYLYGLRPPHEGADLVRAQMRAANDYRNDLVQVERGRRWAIRRLHDTPHVRDLEETLRQATRSTRVAALRALEAARARAEWSAVDPEYDAWVRGLAEAEGYDLSALDGAGTARAAIREREGELRRGARALTTAHWGTYLGIEAAHDQARKAPLYAEDGLTPSDPRFLSWPRDYEPLDGQVGVQIQATRPLSGADLLAAKDSRVRIQVLRGEERRQRDPGSTASAAIDAEQHRLWLRVGSDGKRPIWAKWNMRGMRLRKRAIPDGAAIKWVRVSCRREATRERWTCEITLDVPDGSMRARDPRLSGAIAVELGWWPQDDGSMVVGAWLDSDGERGQLRLPPRLVTGIAKPDGIRSVMDTLRNSMRDAVLRALAESRDASPWVRRELASAHLWESPRRFRRLCLEWAARRDDTAKPVYEILDAWRIRHEHLWDYAEGARGEALRERRELYRVTAARWSRRYAHVLVPDRDLSREARWGEESDRRFAASPQQLRDALCHAFGQGAHKVLWVGAHGVPESDDEDAPTWLETAIEQWRDGKYVERARKRRKSTDHLEKGGAWAARKARKRAGGGRQNDGARKEAPNAAE